ncbi:BLOC-1 related complex subunit 5 isoform X2 [Arctopsyche grandis]|uniref:BLOC-1 related complex subunit 5 isoform X2 n=1 Tax=Arctopsyche grandis TaxID=121162 RepID=UPI00406D9755
MGSEQSTPTVNKAPTSSRITRGHTIAVPLSARGGYRAHIINTDAAPSGSTSPGASVCSDTDLPYISYTLNRPIGDSPKLTGRGHNSNSNKRNSFPPKKIIPQRRPVSLNAGNSSHTIVVVKEAKVPQSSDKDEDILRLQQIPMFLPIMRGTLGLPGARDPEILEGIDSTPWLRLCSRYQAHLTASSQLVSTEQNVITAKCKEVDAEMAKTLSTFVEKQKQGAQIAEKLSHIKFISQQLTRCNTQLEQLLISMKELNDVLPLEEKLEPFVVPVD